MSIYTVVLLLACFALSPTVDASDEKPFMDSLSSVVYFKSEDTFDKHPYVNGDVIVLRTESQLGSGAKFYIDFSPIPEIYRVTLNIVIILKEQVEVRVNACSTLSKTLENVPANPSIWRIVRTSDKIMIWADNDMVADLVFEDDWRDSCKEAWSEAESTAFQLDNRYTTATMDVGLPAKLELFESEGNFLQGFYDSASSVFARKGDWILYNGEGESFVVRDGQKIELPESFSGSDKSWEHLVYVDSQDQNSELPYSNGDSIILKTTSELGSGAKLYIDFSPIPEIYRVTLNIVIILKEQVEVRVNACSTLSKTLENVPANPSMWRIVRTSDKIMIWADNDMVADLVFEDDWRDSCKEAWSEAESTAFQLVNRYTTASVVDLGVHHFSG